MQIISLNNSLRLKVFTSIYEFNENEWNEFVPENTFYQNYQFLRIIEDTQKDIQFRYVFLETNLETIGVLYFQQITFSMKQLGNYKKTNFISKKINQLLFNRQVKLLNLGNVFFTGDTGVISTDTAKMVEHLPDIFKLIDQTFEKKSFAFLTSNISEANNKKCQHFKNFGFHPLPTEPDLFLNIDTSWNKFDDYLDAFSSKYRVRAKKVLSNSASIIQQEISFEQYPKYKNDIEQLFKNVIENAHFSMTEMDCNFFENNLKELPQLFHLYGYFIDDKLVAFSTLYLCNKIIHAHYIGIDYNFNTNYKLYNRMLLDIVKFGINNKVERIHFGRTATEIKTTIGAKPHILNGYLKINQKFYNTIAPYFIQRKAPEQFKIRQPFKVPN